MNRLYIEEGAAIAKEFYLSLLVDRETSRVAVVASTAGGMDIEEVAHSTPELIHTFTIDPATGVWPHHGLMFARALGLSGETAKQARALLPGLYKAFTEKDMSLLEINPLIQTQDGSIKVLDAKMGFDDNALFRHPEVVALRDISEEDEKEIEASKHELSYIALDGDIGCMVNGAGLAMATTMDIIKLYGAEPANFLDVGGEAAKKEKVTAAFKIITSDPQVKGILVNIFGGIMRCDIIAEGVVAAVKEVGLKVPLVVRLEGTNVELGKKIIGESGLNVISANDLADGAEKIVAAVKAACRRCVVTQATLSPRGVFKGGRRQGLNFQESSKHVMIRTSLLAAAALGVLALPLTASAGGGADPLSTPSARYAPPPRLTMWQC